MPAPHHSSFFTGRMPFLPPNQQRQSTKGKMQNIIKLLPHILFQNFVNILALETDYNYRTCQRSNVEKLNRTFYFKTLSIF